MPTEAGIKLTSSELGVLWSTYLSISGRLQVFNLLKDKTIDDEARNIFLSIVAELGNIKKELTSIFASEEAVIPYAFNDQDIVKEAPPLYNDIFNIIFLRHMKILSLGYNAVFTAITYKKEVQNLIKLHYDTCFRYYTISTEYLLKKGVLSKPPTVTMPTHAEFIEDKNYMSGFNFFSPKRTLNTIEVGYIYEALEFNAFLMKLLTGFAQVAKEDDVRKYFAEGIELAKKHFDKISNLLLNNDITPVSTRGNNVTDSTISPFSDKLMMFITSLLITTPLSYSALGTTFSFRNDLPPFLGLIAKDLFSYAKEGGKLMIKYKWLEEPPKMEDRDQLIKSR